MQQETKSAGLTVAQGVVHGLGLNGMFVMLCMVLVVADVTSEMTAMSWLVTIVLSMGAVIGLSQFLYIGPLIAAYRRAQQPHMVKGLIIAAVVTALFNLLFLVVVRS
jgi:hypothetical protein